MEVKEIKKRVLELNRNAMDLLKDSNFEESLEILTTALKILAPADNTKIKYKLLSITQNNLGCYYKRKNQPKIALNYLSQACKSEKKGQLDNTTRSGTYLNICAIYLTLGKHKMALKNSLKALSLLKTSEDTENYISTIVIRYYNTEIECEFLHQANESLENHELA